MSNQTDRSLFNHSVETYNGDFQAHLLEQYKVYVQSAENVSARRIATSRYMLTFSAAIVALYGLQFTDFGSGWWAMIVPIVGTAVSLIWNAVIKSHAALNTAKFEIIHEIEKHLPAAVYGYEWGLLGEGEGDTYQPATKIERAIPWVFVALHVGLAVLIVAENANLVDLAR